MGNKVVAYVRVSTAGQNLDNQELVIRRHAQTLGLVLTDIIGATVSSRKDDRKRRIDELLGILEPGDVLIVTELSRLARSVGQIAVMMKTLLDNKVRVISIKEGVDLNGRLDMQGKVMVTMFSLFAELERDLVSERTREGLARAKAHGKVLGRPKGPGKSRLDGKTDEIKKLLGLGVSKASIAKITGVSWSGLQNFLGQHGIK